MPKRRLKVCTFVTSLEIKWCTSRWVSMLNGKLRFKCNKFQKNLLTLTIAAYCIFVWIRTFPYITVQYSTLRYGTHVANPTP
jgi:hypothetical protein